jgi:hypothetical protein
MKASGRNRAVLLAGSMVVAAASCGLPPEGSGDLASVESTTSALTGATWTNLTLVNGWQNYNGTANAPAVAVLPNGIVLFRGALKATNPSSIIAFYLDAAFRPAGMSAGALNLRTVLGGGTGGTLTYRLDDHAVVVTEDGIGNGVGSAAKGRTTLDGVSFDRNVGTALTVSASWQNKYPYRGNGTTQPAFVKSVDGFVRFQGLMRNVDPNNLDGFLFTLPATTPALIPGSTVFVPVDLAGGGSIQTWGALTIYSNGSVYGGPNPYAVDESTSLEGAWYSMTTTGNTNLPLSNGWHAYSARAVKVGNFGGVVRFQGAISGGSSSTIGTLPTAIPRPARKVWLVGVANGPVPARIMVDTNGVVSFDSVPLNVASQMLSLDGVSYGT